MKCYESISIKVQNLISSEIKVLINPNGPQSRFNFCANVPPKNGMRIKLRVSYNLLNALTFEGSFIQSGPFHEVFSLPLIRMALRSHRSGKESTWQPGSMDVTNIPPNHTIFVETNKPKSPVIISHLACGSEWGRWEAGYT